MFNFNMETPNQKGKRVLLGYLGIVTVIRNRNDGKYGIKGFREPSQEVEAT